MKKLIVIALLSFPTLALGVSSPKYSYDIPKLNDEMDNIYYQMGTIPNGKFKTSSMTLQGITVDSVTVTSSLTLLYIASIPNRFYLNGTANGSSGNLKILSMRMATNGPTENLFAMRDETAGVDRFKIANTGAVTLTNGLVGTTTNDSATAGNVGEQIAASTGATNMPTSGQWGNNISVTLTAGDWDVSVLVDFINDASTTWTRAAAGIGTVTGNDSTGIIGGDTFCDANLPAISTRNGTCVIPVWRASLSGSQQYFLKVLANYSGGTGQYRGRITARRVR